jgi:hypothetical protein
MRYVGYAFAMMFTVSAWAVQFPGPDGTYSGSGALTKLGDGSKISYTVSTIISSANNSYSSHYHYSTGFDYTLSFTLVDGDYGQFTVMNGGTSAGNGFCLGSTCEIELDYNDANLGAIRVNVSYTFNGDTIMGTGHNYTSNTIFQNSATLQ